MLRELRANCVVKANRKSPQSVRSKGLIPKSPQNQDRLGLIRTVDRRRDVAPVLTRRCIQLRSRLRRACGSCSDRSVSPYARLSGILIPVNCSEEYQCVLIACFYCTFEPADGFVMVAMSSVPQSHICHSFGVARARSRLEPSERASNLPLLPKDCAKRNHRVDVAPFCCSCQPRNRFGGIPSVVVQVSEEGHGFEITSGSGAFIQLLCFVRHLAVSVEVAKIDHRQGVPESHASFQRGESARQIAGISVDRAQVRQRPIVSSFDGQSVPTDRFLTISVIFVQYA